MAREKHLYREGAEGPEEEEFERRYGRRKGRYVYGAVVGKVERERRAKRSKKRSSSWGRVFESDTDQAAYERRLREGSSRSDAVIDTLEDDKPGRRGREHRVRGHERDVDGKRERVRPHLAKNPRRRR